MNGTPHSVEDAPEGRPGRLNKRTRSEMTRVAASSKALAGQSRGEASVATRLTIVETLQQRCENFQISRIEMSPLSNMTLSRFFEWEQDGHLYQHDYTFSETLSNPTLRIGCAM